MFYLVQIRFSNIPIYLFDLDSAFKNEILMSYKLTQ